MFYFSTAVLGKTSANLSHLFRQIGRDAEDSLRRDAFLSGAIDKKTVIRQHFLGVTIRHVGRGSEVSPCRFLQNHLVQGQVRDRQEDRRAEGGGLCARHRWSRRQEPDAQERHPGEGERAPRAKGRERGAKEVSGAL